VQHGWRARPSPSPAVARCGDNGCPPQGGLRLVRAPPYVRRVGTGRGTGAQRGLTLDDGRRAQGDLVEGPLDGLLPLPAGRVRRAAWLLAPVWHVGFAVLSVLGVVHAGHVGTVAPLAATALYATAGALFAAVAATLVALIANGFATEWLMTTVADSSPSGQADADAWGATFVAPVVEESAKGRSASRSGGECVASAWMRGRAGCRRRRSGPRSCRS